MIDEKVMDAFKELLPQMGRFGGYAAKSLLELDAATIVFEVETGMRLRVVIDEEKRPGDPPEGFYGEGIAKK